MAILTPLLTGIQTAHALNLSYIEEGVQRLTGRFFMPTVIQTVAIYNAFDLLAACLPLSTPFYVIKAVCVLLPSVVTYATRKIKEPALLRKIYFLHDHMLAAALAVTAAASIALIALGQAALGGATLAVLGIGLLSRYRILPYPLRSCLDKSAFLISSVTSFFLNGILYKVMSAVEIALNLSQKEPLLEEVPDAPESLTELTTLWSEIPPPLFPQECFDKSSEWLEFKKRHLITATPKMIVQEGITRVQQLRFKGSEPKEYTLLEKKLKQIIRYMKEAPLKEKGELITRLGLSAYGYSGAVIWEVDQIYCEKIDAQEGQKLRDKIVEQAIYSHFDPLKTYTFLNYPLFDPIAQLAVDFFNPSDKHNYYLYINMVAPDFELTHSHGAATDQMALSDAIMELGLSLYNRRIAQEIQENYSSSSPSSMSSMSV